MLARTAVNPARLCILGELGTRTSQDDSQGGQICLLGPCRRGPLPWQLPFCPAGPTSSMRSIPHLASPSDGEQGQALGGHCQKFLGKGQKLDYNKSCFSQKQFCGCLALG